MSFSAEKLCDFCGISESDENHMVVCTVFRNMPVGERCSNQALLNIAAEARRIERTELASMVMEKINEAFGLWATQGPVGTFPMIREIPEFIRNFKHKAWVTNSPTTEVLPKKKSISFEKDPYYSKFWKHFVNSTEADECWQALLPEYPHLTYSDVKKMYEMFEKES